jgi:transcriptional regulator with XRE-family HTH domain
MVTMDVGTRIRTRRQELGLTQRQTVQGTGYTHTLLSRIESCERNPTLEFLIAVSENLKTRAFELDGLHADEACPFCGRRPPT